MLVLLFSVYLQITTIIVSIQHYGTIVALFFDHYQASSHSGICPISAYKVFNFSLASASSSISSSIISVFHSPISKSSSEKSSKTPKKAYLSSARGSWSKASFVYAQFSTSSCLSCSVAESSPPLASLLDIDCPMNFYPIFYFVLFV